MKLQVGKRYVTREGEIVGPMFNDGYFRCWQRKTGWYNDGRVFRDSETYCDIIAEYVEPESRIPQLESRISELESRVAELESDKPFTIEVGKRYVRRDGEVTGLLVANSGLSTYTFRDPSSGATYSNTGREFIHTENFMDLVSEYVEPATPVPLPEFLLYSHEYKPIAELKLHDSHDDIRWLDTETGAWVVGLPPYNRSKVYCIRKGSALSYRCKLETLKLEAGKRYVLEDGRVTDRLYTACQAPFATGINDALQWVAADGRVIDTGNNDGGQISHPLES